MLRTDRRQEDYCIRGGRGLGVKGQMGGKQHSMSLQGYPLSLVQKKQRLNKGGGVMPKLAAFMSHTNQNEI